MSKRIIVGLCAVFAIALVASLTTAGTSGIGLSKNKKRSKATQAEPFAISVEYTGSISGDMRIDGVHYTLSKKTTVYVVGEGMRSQGVVVSHQSVYLAGEKRGDAAIVRSVIVRPRPSRDSATGDGSADVGVLTESSPR